MNGRTVLKLLGIVGGVAGSVAATLASGGTVPIAILVGISAATTGAGALYMQPPKGKKAKMRPGQAVDAEDPK